MGLAVQNDVIDTLNLIGQTQKYKFKKLERDWLLCCWVDDECLMLQSTFLLDNDESFIFRRVIGQIQNNKFKSSNEIGCSITWEKTWMEISYNSLLLG